MGGRRLKREIGKAEKRIWLMETESIQTKFFTHPNAPSINHLMLGLHRIF